MHPITIIAALFILGLVAVQIDQNALTIREAGTAALFLILTIAAGRILYKDNHP